VSKKIAVIGLGNTLRRDDGIGILVLESLFKFYRHKEIDYLNFGTTSFDLLHQIKIYDAVLLIDGLNAGLRVGELKINELKDIEYKVGNSVTSTHELNLKDIFELSKDLGIKTKIYVAGIQIKDVSFGQGLSQALMHRKENIVKNIARFIAKTFLSAFAHLPAGRQGKLRV